MTKTNIRKIKSVRAWAVMELPTEIQAFQFDYNGNKQYSIFPTRTEAVIWGGRWKRTIIPVLITPLKQKKRHV